MSKTLIFVKLRHDLIEFQSIIMINRFISNGISFAKMRFELGEGTGDVESDIKSTLHKIYIDHIVLRSQKDFSGLLARLETKIIDYWQKAKVKDCSRDDQQLERGHLIDEKGCSRKSNREEVESCPKFQDCCDNRRELEHWGLIDGRGCLLSSACDDVKNCLRVQCSKDGRQRQRDDAIIVEGTSISRTSHFQQDSISMIDGVLKAQGTEIDKVPAGNRLLENKIRAEK